MKLSYSFMLVNTLCSLATYVSAAPEAPIIDRDVHMTEQRQYTRPTIPTLQTSADGRVGLSNERENGRVALRLQVPEKIDKPFMNSSNGTKILSSADAFAPSEATLSFRDVISTGGAHMTLCDPSFDPNSNIKNPRNCGGDDCYDLSIISAKSDSNNNTRRTLVSTPITVRVDKPKTRNAKIVEVTAKQPIFGKTFTLYTFFEPMTTGDGRLLMARQSGQANGATSITWRDSKGNNKTSRPDAIYFVNDNPDNFEACDVRQWNKVYPLTHAPYDQTINKRYGFAMQEFRDPLGKIIPEGTSLRSYPWIDKGGDNISLTVVNTNLFDPKKGYRANYQTECVTSSCVSARDSQQPSGTMGRVIMGLWTKGKMVLLDNLINNVDFTIRADDKHQRNIRLYDANSRNGGFVRVGNGRDNTNEHLPKGSSGNTSFFDSNEHRFNYFKNMFPVSPYDVSWLMSSGRGTTEVPFDDYLNPNSFLNANMAQALRIESSGRNAQLLGEVQNAATATRWNIPASGKILGQGRIEPVALGGIKGKGFWLDGNGSALEFNIDRQPRNTLNSDWYYSIFVDTRTTSGVRTLLTFPDDSKIKVRGQGELMFVDSSNRTVRTINRFFTMKNKQWRHLGFQLENGNKTISTYLDGYKIDSFTHNAALFHLRPGKLTVGINPDNNRENFKGWIDDFKIFAEKVNVEVACNHARGTLVGVTNNAGTYWNNIVSAYPHSSHVEISDELLLNGKRKFGSYACYHNYNTDFAAHLGNIPGGVVSIRDNINFPEGPLVHNKPRPDSSNNEFCLSCHTSDGKAGLDIDALVLKSGLQAKDDKRRQPLQPDPLVFGNIPANWLGKGLPARHMVADARRGFKIDTLLLTSSSSAGNGGGNSGISVPTGTTSLAAQHSSKCIDLDSGSSANGANIHQWACNANNRNQDFTLKSTSNGFYEIRTKNDKCIGIGGGSMANGANAVQWNCVGAQDQQYRLDDRGNGWFRIVARHSNKCLDVSSASGANGTNIQQWNCSNGDNQRFKFQ
ncbi:RICIN domain-containing protein [Agarilytica rhodophyticola]|uniref:RICIN domain-containing protein n=1 Tax=Agarilytica rhodophyticola TaxID=1737490 RepID=UPI000B340ED6|nr:RICIN domain-containing protein [Agarilytica rhodophyticola]